MNRNVIVISTAVVILVLIALFAFLSPRPTVPAVQITTDRAKVSIGPSGVSVSVQPSAQ